MKLLFSLLLLLVFITVYGQSGQDTIAVTNHGSYYIYNGEQLSSPELVNLIMDNPAAYNEYFRAKSNEDVAMVLGIIGGSLIGWPLGTEMGGGDPEWAIAGVGAGILAIAIPFAVTAKKQTIRAIRLYNEGIKVGREKEMTLKAGIYNDGIGICLKF